jgi:hypothetical protein
MRFCAKPAGLCHVKSHRTKKVLLSNETFYIKHTRVGQARFEPSLPRHMLPEEIEVEDLLEKSKPFVEWSAYLEGIRARKESESVGGDFPPTLGISSTPLSLKPSPKPTSP